ncbi:MAG: transporter substrate-binding domain-containing protein [Saprospiraceae bacterium]|nr:transporter substrate-binding domain-containing protein [Saprospiraceae bacterium]
MEKRILFVSANPIGTSQLRLNKEFSEIKKCLEKAKSGMFLLQTSLSATPRDIRSDLLTFKPHIVHFSGHGSKTDGIYLENEYGKMQYTTTEALTGLFLLFSEQVECVLLNACYSEEQGRAISAHIDLVIGMNDEINDKSAIEYSKGFYDALVVGETIEVAHQHGCNAILMHDPREKTRPIIHKSKNPKDKLNLNNFNESFRVKKELIVGFTYDAPMFYFNQKDEWEGFGFELGEMISKNLGKKLLPRIIQYTNANELIKAGEIDFAIGGFIPGDKHGLDLKWSKSYLPANFSLIVPIESNLKDVDDIDGLTIGVYDEPYVKTWVSDHLPKSKIKAYNHPNWFDCIKENEVDVIINDYPYAVESMKHHSELKFANYHLSDSDVGYSICMPNNDDFVERVNRVLEKIMKSEEFINTLHSKYLFVKDGYLQDKYKLLPNSYKRIHKVKKDETLWAIAEKYYGDDSKWDVIFNLNKPFIPNPAILETGQTLYVPENIPETISADDIKYMRLAINEAKRGMNRNDGGPFGAVIIKDGQIVGRGNNRVTSTNDPTAHAEIVAIRDACNRLKSFQLDDCIIYTSCEPCPMCLGAIYWARPKKVFFACTRHDAARIKFDDNFIYEEILSPLESRSIPTIQILQEEAIHVFEDWTKKQDRIEY